MDTEMNIKIDLVWDNNPVKSGRVTVDDWEMDFVVHKGRLIVSDQKVSQKIIQAIEEFLK